MNPKSFLPAFLVGYLLCMLIVYLVFDFFSWGFAGGSVLGILLFALIITVLKKLNKVTIGRNDRTKVW